MDSPHYSNYRRETDEVEKLIVEIRQNKALYIQCIVFRKQNITIFPAPDGLPWYIKLINYYINKEQGNTQQKLSVK